MTNSDVDINLLVNLPKNDGKNGFIAIQKGFKNARSGQVQSAMYKMYVQKRDFVLLLDDITPPVSRYPYAIVVSTKMCRDRKVRLVTVQMGDGRVRERDIRKIVLLEAVMSDQSADCSATDRNDCITNNDDDEPFRTRL